MQCRQIVEIRLIRAESRRLKNKTNKKKKKKIFFFIFMSKHVMIAGCFLLLLCACSGKNSVKKVTTVVQPSIIHPLFFQEEIAAHLNFPFWFNDSIIRKQGIQSFTWRVYRSTQLDDERS